MVMSDIDVANLVNAILGIIAIIAPIATFYILKARTKLTVFRELIDAIDDSEKDGVLTEAEAVLIKSKIDELIRP